MSFRDSAMRLASIFMVAAIGWYLGDGRLSATAQTPSADKRIALVVGVQQYSAIGSLTSAANDAALLAKRLTAAGYAVLTLSNPTGAALQAAWADLIARADDKTTVAFYFAGHGVEIEGENFLLGRDVSASAAPEVSASAEAKLAAIRPAALSLAQVLADIRVRSPANAILIIDACRENPIVDGTGVIQIGAARGLVKPAAQPPRTFVLYSAGEGELALDRIKDDDANSPFARHLAALADRQDLTLTDLAQAVRFKVIEETKAVPHQQVPAYFDQLTEPVCLSGACASVTGRLTPEEAANRCDIASKGHWMSLKWELALPACRAAVALNPDSMAYKLKLAKAWDKARVWSVSTPLYRELAESGYHEAITSLANAYAKGQGVDRNTEAALAWAKKGAEAGNASSINTLGFFHQHGIGAAPDAAAAKRLFESGVEKNHPGAMLNLARIIEAEQCRPELGANSKTTREEEMVLALDEQAADLGHPVGIGNIGWAYKVGSVVPKDLARAIEFMTRAAELGDPNAMENLGWMHFNGVGGLAKDPEQALYWFRRAHQDPDSGRGSYSLGWMHENGHGVDRDYVEAIVKYREAITRGSAENAYHQLALMYQHGRGVPRGTAEERKFANEMAVALVRRGARLGNTRSMAALGWYYRTGFGMDKPNMLQATRWIRKAASLCNATALNTLGVMLSQGHGVAQPDTAAARTSWERADTLGDMHAPANLADLRSDEMQTQVDRDQIFDLLKRSADRGNTEAMLRLCDNLQILDEAASRTQSKAWCERLIEKGNDSEKKQARFRLAHHLGIEDQRQNEAEVIRLLKLARGPEARADCALAQLSLSGRPTGFSTREAVDAAMACWSTDRDFDANALNWPRIPAEFRRVLKLRLQYEGHLGTSGSADMDAAALAALRRAVESGQR